jgi:hypothetical protein
MNKIVYLKRLLFFQTIPFSSIIFLHLLFQHFSLIFFAKKMFSYAKLKNIKNKIKA